MNGPHELWFLFCERLFKTGPDLARQLWEHVPNRGAVTWQLQIMQARGGDLRVAEERTRRLAGILSPQSLLAAALLVEPEGRGERSEAVRLFEKNVLNITTADGSWRW